MREHRAAEWHPREVTTPEPLFTELDARRLGPVRRFFVRRPRVMDAIVIAWFTLSSASTTAALTFQEHPWQGQLSVLMLLVGAVALYWRRERPEAVLVVHTGLAMLAVVLTGGLIGFDLGVALGVYAVAANRPPARTWTAFGSAVVATVVAVWLNELTSAESPADLWVVRTGTVAVMVFLGLVALALGTSVRGRRQHVAELIERANALARDRDQQAQLARAAERSRIAREMHDVVAHSLSVMIALADGATAALDKNPERSREALKELSSTGRTALADMRRVLGVLEEEQAPLEPQPAGHDLHGLVERFRAAGMTVVARGLDTPLPEEAGFRIAVHRIVQEALTNALRHAPGTRRAEVLLERTPEAVEVTVTDQGPGLPGAGSTSGSGRGVIGMRERVGVYGGVVEAGPWGPGWRVHAVLPLPERSPK